MINRIFSFILALTILAGLPVTASAYDVPDVTRKDCRIEVVLWDRLSDKGIVGAELVLYRVGYVDADSNGHFNFYDVNSQKIIDQVTSQTTASQIHEKVKEGSYTEKYKERFEKQGTYYFTDLPTGLYLVVQEKAAEKYGTMSPFLISVPYMHDGEYQYTVTANVKTELKKETEPTKPSSTEEKPSGGKLPQTGQLTWPIPWLASGGMLLFALGWWLCFGNRKDSYEK